MLVLPECQVLVNNFVSAEKVESRTGVFSRFGLFCRARSFCIDKKIIKDKIFPDNVNIEMMRLHMLNLKF